MLKDLRDKSVYELEPEDFEVLFCKLCLEYKGCPRDEKKVLSCKAFVDSGLWDKYQRKKGG